MKWKPSDFKQKALKDIKEKPFERLSSSVKEIILNKKFYFDSHIHIFDEESVPSPYRNLHIMEVNLQLTSEARIKATIEGKINEEISRLINKIRTTLPIENRETILDFYLSKIAFQDKQVICSTLMMDMELAWKNPTGKSISQQIEEVKELLKKGKPILPFLAIDPRRAEIQKENLYANFLKAFSGDETFFGVKIYPAMGYMPSDPRLMPIYEVCEQLNIPIISHCGGSIIAHSDKCIEIQGLEIKKGKYVALKDTICGSYKAKANFLNHPIQWRPVLERFPQLRLNLAHFGGTQEWRNLNDKPTPRIDTILAFMYQYPNFYTDFSYNIHSKKLNEKLKKLSFRVPKVKERTLLGTDYYVVMAAAHLNLKRRIKNFKKENISHWYNFSYSNPLHFYGLNKL